MPARSKGELYHPEGAPRNLYLRRKPEEPAPEPVVVPEPPDWLPPTAVEVWERSVQAMIQERIWRPCFEPTVAIFASLYAQFTEIPGTFSATKLVQLRLLAGDLGLSPSTIGNVSRIPRS